MLSNIQAWLAQWHEWWAQNESFMFLPQIYKDFTREETGEHHAEELEVPVSFSTEILPFSNAAQQDALAVGKLSCTYSHSMALPQAGSFVQAGSSTSPVWHN